MSEDEKVCDLDNRNWDLEYSTLGSLVTLYKDLSPLIAIYKDLSSVAAVYKGLEYSTLSSVAAISKDLENSTWGSIAAISKDLEYPNLGSFAMASEALSSYNSSLFAVAAEVAKSYNSNLSAMAEAAKLYNSNLFSMATDVLRSSTFSSITDISKAFESTTLDSIATMSGVLKDASTLHLSIISEALTPTKVYSSVTFGNKNSLEILPVEETKVLSLNAEDPRQIFPNLTPNLERSDLEELDSEVQSDYEIRIFEINTKAYKFLCNLEIYLRHLIMKRLIEPYEKNLESKIPQDILSRWEERKKKENSEEFNLIDYSDFTDLKIIFEKKSSRKSFNDLFSDEEYNALITKLHELDPIRKKIAHIRPLSKKEFNRLVLYHDDIYSIINNRQN